MSADLPWTIVHVAVREPLPDLAAEPGSGGRFLVFWCDGLPVGQLSIPSALLPLTAAQLAGTIATTIAPAVAHRSVGAASPRGVPRDHAPSWTTDVARLIELERPLATCAGSALRGASDTGDALVPSVSVVIRTRNHTQSLRKCLASLRGLSPPPDEVIVIDNDPSSSVTADVTAAFPGVRYVAEPRGGENVARNAGIRHSTGAIVAFIGDDVVVHAGWIGAVRQTFADPQVMAFTGLVLPAELATRAQLVIQHESLWDYRASEFDGLFFRTWHRVGLPLQRMGTGANMAFRREAFARTGVFDERLGAWPAGTGEDTDLWYRLLARGHRCRYEPAAVVFQTQRREWPELSDQTYRDMRGSVAALLFQFDRDGYWGNLYRAFVAIPLECLTLAFKAVKRSVLTADGGRDTLVRPLLPQILGVIGGYGYYLRHRWDRANAATIGKPGAEGSETSRAFVNATDLRDPPRP